MAIQKSDEVKFGKFKGKTWEELLGFEAGQSWIRWYCDTPSEGKYANANNAQKAEIRKWLGDDHKDTRVKAKVVDMAFVLSKLEVIERLLNTLIAQKDVNQYEKETDVDRIQWDE